MVDHLISKTSGLCDPNYKRIGDCTRRRRFADRVRRKWYAHYRAVRFARRFGGKGFVPADAVAGTARNHGLRQACHTKRMEQTDLLASWNVRAARPHHMRL